MKSIVDNKDFKPADKLKRLAEVENCVSDYSNSNYILQLEIWKFFISSSEAINNSTNIDENGKNIAIDALRKQILYSVREPLIMSSTSANLRSELQGDTVDRRRSIAPTEATKDVFESPPAPKRFSAKFKNIFKKNED
jgi:hypothetical protein